MATLDITRNLEPGMTGADVKSLQTWLISQGYKISSATGYYGNETKAAVEAWQRAQPGFDAGQYWGYFGPRSLKVATAPTSTSTNTAPVGTTTTTNTAPQKTFDSWRTSGLTNYDDTQELTKEEAYSRLSTGLNQAGSLTTISSSQIEKVKQDPALLAFYVGALAYGEYTLGDVYKDIKRRELIASGKTEYENMMPISGELDRAAYAQTDDGRSANTNPAFTSMKLGMGNIDPSIFNLPLFSVPDELFKQLVPILNPNTPEYRAEIEKIQSVYYDLSKAVIEANTEQARAYAVDQLDKAKEIINRTYGVQLSNNAGEAWKQIEGLGTSSAQAGISGSGIQNEAVDDVLREARRRDENTRQNKLSEEESKMSEHYRKFGTSEEINKLIEEDKAKGLSRDQWRATKWGLVPSQDVLGSLDINALKQKYPDIPEEKLRRTVNNIVDPYGNYRSTLYATKMSDLETALQDKEIKASTEYTAKQDALQKKAYQEFDRDTQNPFILPKTGTTAPTTTTQTPIAQPAAPKYGPTQYAGGLQPDDPRNMYNTATGQLNTNYKPPVTAPASTTPTQQYALPSDFSTNASAYTFDPVKGWVKK